MSQMINFRIKDEDAVRLDMAAKMAGQSRSDFIRRAVGDLVNKYTGDSKPLEAAPGRGKAKEAPAGTKFPDCPKNPLCNFSRLPTGIKVCTTCGVKKR